MEHTEIPPHEAPPVEDRSRKLDLLAREFPEAMREGKLDLAVLGELLGLPGEAPAETFGLNWHGKRQARQLAQTPPAGTLRPAPEESLEWDTTGNLILEGDNLEVLKLLQKSYAGAVKLIYIDPPYNTGSEFVYEDDFRDSRTQYLARTGHIANGAGAAGDPEGGGRLHTAWLNMMYPRLRLARNLLRPDGLVFISIGDEEVAHLRLLLDELFGEENFEGHIHWRRRPNQPNDPTKMLGLVAEHLLVYAKDKAAHKRAGVGKIPLTGIFSNPDGDPRGDWASKPWKIGSDQSGSRYDLTTPSGVKLTGEWMGDEATYQSLLADGRIVFPGRGKGSPRKKYFRSEREREGQCATNWWSHERFGHNQGANGLLTELFGRKNVFSNPKPIELLTGILEVGNLRSGDIILDFFAGSGTTGHAVLARNAEDQGDRRYILVQLPEALDPAKGSQSVPAGFCRDHGLPCSLAEITKERMRRAARQLREVHSDFNGDAGFKVFKLAPCRREDVKEERLELDLLYELHLRFGLDLALPYDSRKLAGMAVHRLGGGILFACLATAIGREDGETLAQDLATWCKALPAPGAATLVFREGAFADNLIKGHVMATLGRHGFDDVRSL
jgi:adenine-specific DNA-methyltransferase